MYISESNTDLSSPPIKDIQYFYSLPELHPRQTKMHSLSISDQIHLQQAHQPQPRTLNFYSSLPTFPDIPMMTQAPTAKPHQKNDNGNMANTHKSYFVKDLAVNEILEIVRHRMNQDRQEIDTSTDEAALLSPQPNNLSLDIPVAQRIRVNLIRHRFARNTDMTTLKLFQSLAVTLRKVDKNIAILPYNSKKQQYTALVSPKQIEHLNDHQLKLYFQPWHCEQYYSLGGFLHISSTNSFDEIFTQAPMTEWLDTYQYSVKRCSSQAEEMAVVGALCYGSSWIYREDLKSHIMQHPEWQRINSDPNTPIIFDLILRNFHGSKKSTPMIFVSAERSKQEQVRDIFKQIYDGTAKEYPRGDMLFFIPTRNGDQYTTEQRDKFIFNNETYLGNEEITAIHGLQNLNTKVTLTGGKKTTLRTLLKSIPATEGMSRNKLFQVVDPNAGQPAR